MGATMKQLILAFLMMSAAYAEPPTPIYSAEDIVNSCRAGDFKEVAAYASGIIDFHVYMRSGGLQGLVCPPSGATSQKLGVAVCEYSKRKPALAAEGGSALLVLTAGQEVFPCKSGWSLKSGSIEHLQVGP